MSNSQENYTSEQRVAYVEKHEQNPIVKRVLCEGTSFEKLVEDFYDLSTRLDVVGKGVVRRYELKEDKLKTGAPTDLITILSGFSTERFDEAKLHYTYVRDDYQRWYSPSRESQQTFRMVSGISGLLASCSAIAALIVPLIAPPDHYTDIISKLKIPLGLVAMGGYATYIWSLISYNTSEPEGTDHSLLEFLKLHASAESADDFMRKTYRQHFINKTLKK